MAFADTALSSYESLEDVRKQEIPESEEEPILRFKDSASEWTILRQCTKTGGAMVEPMPKSDFLLKPSRAFPLNWLHLQSFYSRHTTATLQGCRQ